VVPGLPTRTARRGGGRVRRLPEADGLPDRSADPAGGPRHLGRSDTRHASGPAQTHPLQPRSLPGHPRRPRHRRSRPHEALTSAAGGSSHCVRAGVVDQRLHAGRLRIGSTRPWPVGAVVPPADGHQAGDRPGVERVAVGEPLDLGGPREARRRYRCCGTVVQHRRDGEVPLRLFIEPPWTPEPRIGLIGRVVDALPPADRVPRHDDPGPAQPRSAASMRLIMESVTEAKMARSVTVARWLEWARAAGYSSWGRIA
jgi:hypothetical protein